MIPTSYIQDALNNYCEKHSNTIPEYLNQLERMTYEKCISPQMLSGSIQGRFLAFISQIKKPSLALEIGTFTGYSALCIAEGVAENGVLHTIEISDIYQEFISFAKLQTHLCSKIKFHTGNAKTIIPQINGNFDYVFLDAGKKDYLEFLQLIEGRMNSGSLLITDNVLWSGKVLDEDKDEDTRILHAFNQYLVNSNIWDVWILPIRDGISIATKK